MEKAYVTEQIANNNQVDDYYESNKMIRPDFSGKTLEMKYKARTSKELNDFLANKAIIKRIVHEVKRDLHFSKIICRMYFGKYEPELSIQIQKQLVDLQNEIFDEITIQLVNDNIDNFKALMEYTQNKYNKPVSTLADTNLEITHLEELFQYFTIVRPENTRWIYHKLSANIERFFYIQKGMTDLAISYKLVGCNYIMGTDYGDYKDLDVSTVCKIKFGFDACALDYDPAPEKKGIKLAFSPKTRVFDESSYEWKDTTDRQYRIARTNNFFKQDKADISQKAINQRPKLKNLLEQLKEPPVAELF